MMQQHPRGTNAQNYRPCDRTDGIPGSPNFRVRDLGIYSSDAGCSDFFVLKRRFASKAREAGAGSGYRLSKSGVTLTSGRARMENCCSRGPSPSGRGWPEAG